MKASGIVKSKKTGISIRTQEKDFPIVAIGASVGGLEAITAFLKNLPADTGMAFIYVQHLSPDHKSFLPSILSKITKMGVQEIEDMEQMAPNNVYVIPHDKGIQVTDGHIQLLPRPKNISTNLSIDVLFSSLAQTHKENVIGVILSGNANDGTQGLKAIKAMGGLTFAQDDSAQASSMPRSAIAAGVVDYVMSPKEIARKLSTISKNGFPWPKKIVNKKKGIVEVNNQDLKAIFELLFKKTGVDFTHYKKPTIKRRLNHKMLQCGAKTIREYANLLGKKNSEVDLLYKDLLIHVTDFFRDKEAFRYLKTTFLPKLLKSKNSDETIRIWVAACSSGQEAYSLAMMLTELQENKTRKIPVQIFATDLSENAIHIARTGEYSKLDMQSVPKKYVDRFFVKTGETYRIIKELREMCIFAPHNILRDPPFSRIDFITCCNLLIYFDAAAQKKVFAALHFALNEHGHLMLGKAETIGGSSQLFTGMGNKFKIFSRKKNAGIPKILELSPYFPRTYSSNKKINIPIKSVSPNPTNIENALDAELLASYMPACAVINKDMDILQFRGPVSLFLTHPPGKTSLNILKMTRPEFAFELRNTIDKALKTKQAVLKSGIELQVDSVVRLLTLEVRPLKIEWDEPLLLIVFTLQEQLEQMSEKSTSKRASSILKDRRIKKLTDALSTTRTEMNSVIESQEVIYEELQAANEEIVSTNEEFQTLNEELETSKEEIEATNEELIFTNTELQMRNDLLVESYEYSEAIIATIHEPMLVLNKDLHVKSANKSFYHAFHVKQEDTEGHFLFELGNNQWNIPKLRGLLNDIVANNSSFQNFEVRHTFPVIGEKIMMLNAHRIIQKTHCEQLILLAFEDITERSLYSLKEKALHKLESEISDLALKSKQQFLSNMSHEIRTPMNSIIGFTNVVLKTPLNAEQKEYIDAIKTSGDALLVLINDILDLAKVDAGKMTFEHTPFNLFESVSSMLYLFDTKLKEKKLDLVKEFSNQIPDVLIGDQVRLRQIILNLVSNAVKFTAVGKITFSIRMLKEDSKNITLQFTVSDTGIGIPANQLGHIFDNFSQASNNTTMLYGGTGLGLAIVKQLVELQEGKLIVKSKVGKGSTFGFVLNFKKTNAKILVEPEVELRLDTGAGKIKVLVVEDSPMNQVLMKIIIGGFGFKMDLAANGKIAIEKLQKNTYDIVLMDLQMPEMNGFEATDYIRNKLNSKIPIIALTADVTTVDLAKCKSWGMNDYISKPIQEKLLYTKMLSFLKPADQKKKKTQI
jgi:two-component system CheB/CheR fusion protein